MRESLQESYNKMCIQKGLIPLPLQNAPETFTPIQNFKKEIIMTPKIGSLKSTPPKKEEKPEMVLISKELLKEIINALKVFEELEKFESRADLKKVA